MGRDYLFNETWESFLIKDLQHFLETPMLGAVEVEEPLDSSEIARSPSPDTDIEMSDFAQVAEALVSTFHFDYSNLCFPFNLLVQPPESKELFYCLHILY